MTITINGTTGIAGVDGSASTPAVQGADTNTGIFFPAADTIAFAEGGTEVMRLDSSANLQFNSGYGSVATAYGCRAWVNFDGTTNVGGNCTIRASGNVSTVADNGTGDYTINFTTAMPDEDYTTLTGTPGVVGNRSMTAFSVNATNFSYTVNGVRVLARLGASSTSDATTTDLTYAFVAVFR
jgi:hypothetical protein